MKKTTRHGNVSKGNLKIYNFFTKQDKCKAEPTAHNCARNSVEKSLITKRKVEDDISGPPQKKINSNYYERDATADSGTSKLDKTPEKSYSPIISLKSPEQLLSPKALVQYYTPEKKLERFIDKLKVPTPKKMLFHESTSLNTFSVNDSFLDVIDKMVQTNKEKRQTTPKKNIPNSNCKSTEKTPNKTKRTPKKLFNKSPCDLTKFNVNSIQNFVKVTPSKNGTTDPDVIFVKSSEKKQISILKYFSPSPSPKSAEAQKHNESTPVKHSEVVSSEFITPTSRVKTKLNFSYCDSEKPSTSKGASNLNIVKSPKLNEKAVFNVSKTSLSPNLLKIEKTLLQENNLNLTNVEFNFDDDWPDEIPMQLDYNLDLSESRHCKIIDKNVFPRKVQLVLECTKSGDKALCILEGFWLHSQVNVGDIVHVSAKKSNEFEWIVNNDHGFLVYEPDLLISATSIVNSLWCKRKSILTDYFRGFEPSNEAMLVGSLAHKLLQTVLKNKLHKQTEIETVLNDLLNTRNTISNIYECGLTLQHISDELQKFVPKIQSFLHLYVNNSHKQRLPNLKHKKDDWKGTINAIDDIEENIWCPELGIKGKVDVSVKTGGTLMPLEVKTGRASVSLEHRGQVLMYIMMMNKLGYNVPSGLLLYLREGVLREVSSTQSEKRDIMILRNELAYYLTRKARIVEDEATGLKKLFPPNLPEPINHKSCANCPYNVICTAYAKYNNEDISSMSTLKLIQDEIFSHVQESHLNYFMHWVSLIDLESDTNKGSKELREIYTVPPEKRESNGKCIINLKVSHVGEEYNGIFDHTFVRIDQEPGFNFFSHGIAESNYVVVSIATRPAVSSGFVTDITTDSITIALDRNLKEKYENRTFSIDSYDSNSIQSYNLTSLTLLLELSDRSENLRKIVIDRAPPTFRTRLPKIIGTKGKQILRRLNLVQQRAVLRAIAANDYFLIKGMPGTGKTATIVALIQLLVELGKSVLITSHTHSAVDNVCLRLVSYGVKLLRLGSESRIHPNLKDYSENRITKNCSTPEELEAVYNNAQVLAVTCLGSSHPILSKRVLDICIVDESTQVLQCSVIRPLHSAKTFILIGDPDQLPAVIRNREAVELGMSESLFERLYNKEASVALNLNYRMNTEITSLANHLTYDGELLIGSENVAKATLKLPRKEVLKATYKEFPWLVKALDDSIEKSVQFLDTGPVWELQNDVAWYTSKNQKNESSESQNCVNLYEAAVVFHLVKALLLTGVPPVDIGVMATYRAQVAQISYLLQDNAVDVSTVDQFQGKDKSVIIYSSTKSRNVSIPRADNKFELLEDKRRLTVAVTRAKHKLIVVGDVLTLQEYSTFKKILPYLQNNIIALRETGNFDWEDILKQVQV